MWFLNLSWTVFGVILILVAGVNAVLFRKLAVEEGVFLLGRQLHLGQMEFEEESIPS